MASLAACRARLMSGAGAYSFSLRRTSSSRSPRAGMVSTTIAELARPAAEDPKTSTTTASITDVQHLSSYNWIDAPEPTIVVPGAPRLWSPPRDHQRVPKDSGRVYANQNAARHPDSPLEPLFRALYIENPSFDISSVDLVTDRNSIRKLLSFINPMLAKNGLEPFIINVEVTKNTAIFCRTGTDAVQFIGPNDFVGYGKEFEKAFTISEVENSTGYHRIISYRFGDIKLMVRYETDGYIGLTSKAPNRSTRVKNDNQSEMTVPMTLPSLERRNHAASVGSKLVIKKDGKAVPKDSILEIKTRVFHKPIDLQEVLPQLWVSQTLNLVRASHNYGLFERPKVEGITDEIREWEDSHQRDLKNLVTLIKKIIDVVKKSDGSAVVQYDNAIDRLLVSKADGRKMLPDDLYLKFESGKPMSGAQEAHSNHNQRRLNN
ncbi:hypothetical protein UA08_02021 [Talaromyces atroroseus]|uniref:Geranylgeranyl pyrophosphate synthetase n=1 Tax=Talaromyces atroroseus TaxID=1441469 RepID=A0A1Q5QAS9_TALAT|nr:hypothetical protein UA08_02021 [Talaromyces atroroseus]OKL63053.1 hypothetical protein UA08_02021 [Talaromyces atroroseus]